MLFLWCSDPVCLSSSIGTCNVHKTCLPVTCISYVASTGDSRCRGFMNHLFPLIYLPIITQLSIQNLCPYVYLYYYCVIIHGNIMCIFVMNLLTIWSLHSRICIYVHTYTLYPSRIPSHVIHLSIITHLSWTAPSIQ